MSIAMGQVPVPGNATIPVFLLPTGLANFLVFQPNGTAATIYVGSGPNLSKANGLPVPPNPVNVESYNSTAGGRQFYATTGSSTASTFQFIISTAQ